jgi:predicted ATPase/DNA-binding SARP family transcriptional activator
LEFGILGPLEVRADGRAVPLGGARPRAVFAVLALHANQPVSAERLAVALWGEDVPPSAVKTVQVYIARLRKALEDPTALLTTPAGYCLRVRPGELDAERFEREVADGRKALAAGDAADAAALLRAALELWRGPPLADLASTPFAPPEIARLEEQRLAAVEVRVDADLAAGRHAELVGELQQLTTQHPWRERLHAQLMLALYRSGRQADALKAYRNARDVLVDQLGIEPGTELHDLQQAIFAHEPRINAPATTATPPLEGRDGRPGGTGALGDQRLPESPNRTVGRRRELDAVVVRLRTSSVRLVTLTGPGGVGKTRLALEAARSVEPDSPDGARFITLAALQRAEEVPDAIVRALDIVVLEGESGEHAVERFLAGKQLLLALDNCEHVLAAAPFIGGVLRSCPGVTVLATSREPLALQAEEIHPVPPLALREHVHSEPASPDGDAVELFAERARAHHPMFELSGRNATAVAEICRRVDGLPLAIELAAALCGLLSPVEIAQRLGTALGALGTAARDAPARQHTLRATIDWSHDLLNEDERACFARFAVFAGGATVEAAEAITGSGLGTLDRLVAKSLLVRRGLPDAETRLTMLETVRAYATERFAAVPDAAAIRERHYQHFSALAHEHGSERALWGASAKQHLARLDPEIQNLHAGLGWAVNEGATESALTLCATLGCYWLWRDRYAEAAGWIDAALSMPGADEHPALQVRVLCLKTWTLWPLGRKHEQTTVGRQAEAIARTLAEPLLLCEVLYTRAGHEGAAGRAELAGTLADEALHLARTADDDWAAGMAAFSRTFAANSAADLRERVDLAAALLEAAGNVYQLAYLLASVTYTALSMGSDRDASDFAGRATRATRELDSPYLWMLLRGNVGLTALFTGDPATAREAFQDELKLCRALVHLPFMWEGVGGLAAVAAARGDLDRAARLFGAAAAHRYGEQDDAIDARLHATYFQPARSRHGPDAWDAASRDGAAMSFADAIAYALDEPNG